MGLTPALARDFMEFGAASLLQGGMTGRDTVPAHIGGRRPVGPQFVGVA